MQRVQHQFPVQTRSRFGIECGNQTRFYLPCDRGFGEDEDMCSVHLRTIVQAGQARRVGAQEVGESQAPH